MPPGNMAKYALRAHLSQEGQGLQERFDIRRKLNPITKQTLESILNRKILLSVPYPYCKASGAQLALLVIILTS